MCKSTQSECIQLDKSGELKATGNADEQRAVCTISSPAAMNHCGLMQRVMV